MNAGVRELATRTGRGLLPRRWSGALMDLVILAIAVVVVNRYVAELSDDPTVPVALAIFLPAAYYFAQESLWGTTVGKRVFGLRVVNVRGEQPGVGQILVRTLLRYLEVNPFLFGGIPAGLAAYVSDHRQRIGDLFAGTYVLAISELETLGEPLPDGTRRLLDERLDASERHPELDESRNVVEKRVFDPTTES